MKTSQTEQQYSYSAQPTTLYKSEHDVQASSVSYGGAGTNLAGSYTSPQKTTDYYVSSYDTSVPATGTGYNYTYEATKSTTYENPIKTSYVSTSGVGTGTGAAQGYTYTSNVGTGAAADVGAGQGYTYTSTSGVQGDINSILAGIGGATGTYTTTTYTTQQPVTYTSTYAVGGTGTGLSSSQTIPITSQSIAYNPVGVTTGYTAQSTYLAASGEVKKEEPQKQSRLAQSNVARLSQAPRQNLLTPYRATMYPEFELVEDLPDRKNLVDSINLLLQKSNSKETLLVSPTRVSIKRQSILSPAEIEFETLLKLKDENGTVYEGEGKDGVKHGKGKITYKDGRIFEGEFNHGKAEGTGILRFKTGKVCYEGGFDGEEFQGQGVLQCETPIPLNGDFDHTNFDNLGTHWTKYEGEFKDGKRHGNGTLYLTNGEKFTGEWRDDKIAGRGVFEQRNGQTVQGHWSENKFQQAH